MVGEGSEVTLVKSEGNISKLANKSGKIRVQPQLKLSSSDKVLSTLVVTNLNDTVEQLASLIQETFREEYKVSFIFDLNPFFFCFRGLIYFF